MDVDIIVNSAHPTPIVGGGVDAAIHLASGPKLISARRVIGDIETGHAKKTDAYDLNAKYVIHTVGPVWKDGDHNEEALLNQCYQNSLKLADELGCNSIAFPLISAGVFGYPIAEAIQVASKTIQDFLVDHEISIYLVVYEHEAFRISKLFNEDVEAYIDTLDIGSFSEEIERKRRYQRHSEGIFYSNLVHPEPSLKKGLKDQINDLELTFSEKLLSLIDESGKTDPEVYKKANIDRKLFNKIKNNPDYQPSKATCVALAIALEMNMKDTLDLIGRAGFAFSRANKFDIIIAYCINRRIYNVYDINEALYDNKQPLLGSL